jgi:hypothetical protein
MGDISFLASCTLQFKEATALIFNEILSLIFPSIISVLFYFKLIKREVTFIDLLTKSAVYMLLINIVCYAILVYLFKTHIFIFSPTFTIKYSVLATFLGIITVLFHRFIELNVNMNLKVEHADEE